MVDPIWSGDQLDLAAYFARIGYNGPRDPTLEVLRAVCRAHVLSIPFENLDALLGQGVPLDLASLQEKLFRRRRGGYCYEHVTLFAAALERLGFSLTGLAARVCVGAEQFRPVTHALLRVETAETRDLGQVWICDIGFGASPLVPLELADGAETAADDWRYRLERRVMVPGCEEWTLCRHNGNGWVDQHVFTLAPHYPVDYLVGNHYVATHPRSPFVARLFIQRVLPDRLRVLDGLTLTETYPRNGARETHKLEPREVPEILESLFGIVPEPDDARRMVAHLKEAQQR